MNLNRTIWKRYENFTEYVEYLDKLKITKNNKELFIRYKKENDIGARDQIVINHLRLAFSIAKNYQHQNIEFTDLVQEANYLLLKAIELFDIEREVKPSTFITRVILSGLIHYVADVSSLIKINPELRKYINMFNIIEAKKGSPIEYEDVKEMKITLKRFKNIQKLKNSSYIAHDNIEIEYSEYCEPDYSELTIALNNLTYREKQIIELCFFEKKLIAEISEIMNLSIITIKKSKKIALEKLKSVLELKKIYN